MPRVFVGTVTSATSKRKRLMDKDIPQKAIIDVEIEQNIVQGVQDTAKIESVELQQYLTQCNETNTSIQCQIIYKQRLFAAKIDVSSKTPRLLPNASRKKHKRKKFRSFREHEEKGENITSTSAIFEKDDIDDAKQEHFIVPDEIPLEDEEDSNASSSGNDNEFEPIHELLTINKDNRDIFEWQTRNHVTNDTNIESSHQLFYDSKGQEIFASDVISKIQTIEFVVLVSLGLVLSFSYPGCYIFKYRRERDVVRYAPCKLLSFRLTHKQKLQCKVKWMRKHKSFQKHDPESFLQPNHFIDTIACIDLRGACAMASEMPCYAKAKIMPRYKTVLQHWENFNPSNLCSLPLGHKLYNNANADVFDFLEFFYAKDCNLWRTHLGEWIYATYISKIIDFGDGPRLQLVSDIMQTCDLLETKFSLTKNGPCDACGKNGITCSFMIHGNTKYFGSWCSWKMKYAYEIGREMQIFRTYSRFFEAEQCQKFTSQLQLIFATFKAHKF